MNDPKYTTVKINYLNKRMSNLKGNNNQRIGKNKDI